MVPAALSPCLFLAHHAGLLPDNDAAAGRIHLQGGTAFRPKWHLVPLWPGFASLSKTFAHAASPRPRPHCVVLSLCRRPSPLTICSRHFAHPPSSLHTRIKSPGLARRREEWGLHSSRTTPSLRVGISMGLVLVHLIRHGEARLSVRWHAGQTKSSFLSFIDSLPSVPRPFFS